MLLYIRKIISPFIPLYKSGKTAGGGGFGIKSGSLALFLLPGLLPMLAYAVPQSINYQGVYRESGTPVTGERPMTFKLCDSLTGSCAGTCQAGNACLWTSGELTVNVSTGVFRTSLQVPTSVDWGSITPYLEVSVGTTTLFPRDPISSTPYAFFASKAQALVFGSSSTIMGYLAGYNVTTGSDNLLLGFKAGDSLTTGSRNIIIGYDADAPSATTSNYLNIGGLIYGDLSTGKVGIGTTAPITGLDVLNSSTGLFGEKLVLRRLGAGDVGMSFQQNGTAAFGIVARSGVGEGLAFVDNYYEAAAGNERVRILSNGNVGIGTAAPNARLQVAGGDAAITTQGNGLILRDTDGNGCHRVTVNSAGVLAAALVACP